MRDSAMVPALEGGIVPLQADLAWLPAATWLAQANTLATRQSYLKSLRDFARAAGVGPMAITGAHVAAYKAHLVDEGLSPRTVRLRLSAIRAFFEWFIQAGHHPGPNPVQGVSLPKAGGSLAGRALSQAEVDRLVSAASNPRDRALLWLLASGLRAGEAISLEQRDVRFQYEGAEVLVRNGKGGRTRQVEVGYVVSQAIAAYQAAGLRTVAPRDPLLQRLDRSGAALTYSNVYRIVVSSAARAGLGHLAPHDLRRTYISEMLDLGMPLPQVQRQAGHVLMEQTARYYRARDV